MSDKSLLRRELSGISYSFLQLSLTHVYVPTCYYPVCHSPYINTRVVRLACLIHAASVHPELGSNSTKKQTESHALFCS